MATKFPPPPEVLAHPLGHLVHSVRPHYARKKNKEQKLEDREITHYTVFFFLKNPPFVGSFGWNPKLSTTPVLALEAGIAAATAHRMEHPDERRPREIGRHTPAKRKTAKERRLEKEAWAKKMTDMGLTLRPDGSWEVDLGQGLTKVVTKTSMYTVLNPRQPSPLV